MSRTTVSNSLSRLVCDRRRALIGLLSGLVVVPSSASCKSRAGEIVLPDLRRRSDTDDSAAFARALELGAPVYCPAGRGSGSDGAYVLSSVPLISDTTIRGDGSSSILRLAPEARSVFIGLSSPDTPLENVALSDFRIEGRVTETGFKEHWNLISLAGISILRIERVEFIGFAGDGLYLGAEHQGVAREPRMIRDILVRDCLFDGVNNDNRNGISVTGGEAITIDGCRFRRCSRPDMPGPIDFEPDAFPFYKLARLRVTNCDFEACGGNVGQVSIVIPPVVPPPRDVLISGNRFRGYRGTGGDVAVTINRQPDSATPAMRCVIEDNVGIDGHGGVQIFSGKDITVRNNRWADYAGRSLFGYNESTAGVLDVTVMGDQFVRCGWRDGIAVAVYKGDGIALEGLLFRETGNGTPGAAPLYLGPGRIRRLSLIGNDWRGNPASAGLVIVERGADYLPGTTRVAGNLVAEGRSLPAF